MKTYLALQWKKGIRLIPFFFLVLLISALLLCGCVFLLGRLLSGGSAIRRIEVGVVSPDDDAQTMAVARAVERMESVRSVAGFRYVSEEEAQTLLQNGKIQAVIYLNQDMYRDVDEGINTPVRIRIAEGSEDGLLLFKDLVTSGVNLIQTAEASVYALADVSTRYSMKADAQTVIGRIVMHDFAYALDRDHIWTSSVLSVFGTLTPSQYYTVSAFLGILLLFGIGYASLYRPSERTVETCLLRMGIGTLPQAASRIIVMTGGLWIMMLIIYTGYRLIAWAAGLPALFEGTLAAPVMILLLLPAAFSAAAYMHLVYAWTAGRQKDAGHTGGFPYLAVSVMLFAFGGGLLPVAYLPSFLRKLIQFFPVSLWQRYMTAVLQAGSAQTSAAQVGFLQAGSVQAGFAQAETLAAAAGRPGLLHGAASTLAVSAAAVIAAGLIMSLLGILGTYYSLHRADGGHTRHL